MGIATNLWNVNVSLATQGYYAKHLFVPRLAIKIEGIVANLANADAKLAGGVKTATSVLLIQDVPMEHVTSHGNATVPKVGVACYATKS